MLNLLVPMINLEIYDPFIKFSMYVSRIYIAFACCKYYGNASFTPDFLK